MLVRITGPNFVAGVVFEDDEVRVAAPIVRWAVGLTVDQLHAEIKRRGFTAAWVRTLTTTELKSDR